MRTFGFFTDPPVHRPPSGGQGHLPLCASVDASAYWRDIREGWGGSKNLLPKY